MAKINAKGQITGVVGPVYLKQSLWGTVLQSKPGKGRMRQTNATKSSAADFGTASKLSKRIRMALYPMLQDFTDFNMFRRLTAKLQQVLQGDNINTAGNKTLIDGNCDVLQGFPFNTNSLMPDWCRVAPQLDYTDGQQLAITIPFFDPKVAINLPQYAGGCTLYFMVTVFEPAQYHVVSQQSFSLPINFGMTIMPESELVSDVIPGEHFVVVTMAVSYPRAGSLFDATLLNDKNLHPCEILLAFKS